MHRSESAQLATCVECCEEIWPERDRSYLVIGEDALCFACAVRRGGAYDELEDRWTKPPSVEGLRLKDAD